MTQGLNPDLLHCRQTLYRLSHQTLLIVIGLFKLLLGELYLFVLFDDLVQNIFISVDRRLLITSLLFSHSVMSDSL